MTLSSVKFVVHFMFLVDLLLGALDDIDEYNGFAYSSFHGPVSGDVKPVYFTDPYTPGQTLVDYLAKPDYKFAYGVSDPDTGNSQKHQESRDGDSVKGEYSLIEPDGYIRRVIYTADPTRGFQATVIYEPPSGALPSPSLNAYSNLKSLPATPNFPYEEIMNSIPDLHDIPIPHYDSVDTIHNKQYETTDIPYNNHEESKAYDSTQNYLEPKFYEDTNSLRSAHQSGDEGNLYDSSNVVQSDAYNNLEEGPSNRVYDSTEVNNINNLYDPKIETTSAEYESYYQ